jgi:large subunit ribosomal protein L13
MKALRGRTYSATASEAQAGQRWYLIDAEGQVLGRVATTVAQLLRGKGKPTFTPHMDGGDFVVVVNAEKIVVTGTKETDKKYYRHSGYPGGLRETTLKEMRARHPIRILEAAVRGMLPKNRLGERIYHHLKVYAGPEHPHEAQKPQRLELAREGHKRGQFTEQAAGSMATTPEPAAAAEAAASAETAVEPVAPVEAKQEQQ